MTGPAGLALPVGSIVAYWGSLKDLSEGYELCDGELVTTPDSPIRATRKPDLRDRFIKSARAVVTDSRQDPESGGSNTISLKHSHPAGELFALITQQRVSGNNFNLPLVTRGKFKPTNGRGFNGTTASAGITGGWSGREDYGDPDGTAIAGETGPADITFDNRPAFTSLLYVLKVK